MATARRRSRALRGCWRRAGLPSTKLPGGGQASSGCERVPWVAGREGGERGEQGRTARPVRLPQCLRMLMCSFQWDLSSMDQKVESVRKVSNLPKKKRRKRR